MAPLAASVRYTVAPGTAAPLLSVTVPVTVPVDWPKATGEPIHNSVKRQNNTATTRLLSMQLPPGWAMTGSPELCTPRLANCQSDKRRTLEDPIDQKSTLKLGLAERESKSRATTATQPKL